MYPQNFGVYISHLVLCLLSEFHGSHSGNIKKDLSEVIFRVEAYRVTDGGNRILTFFKIFNGMVDFN